MVQNQAVRATVSLINPATRNGFLHVTTDDGDKGWVFAQNVEIQDEGDANEGGGVEDEILSLRNVLAVAFRFAGIEREVILTPDREQAWLLLSHP